MIRYTATIGLPWIMVLAFFMVAYPSEKPPIESMLMLARIMAAVAVPWTLLGLYGIAATFLAGRKASVVAQDAEIPEDSWHFRLNRKVEEKLSGDRAWEPPKTECQYWALTFHNLGCTGPLVSVFFFVVYCIKFAVVWPVGFVFTLVPAAGSWNATFDGEWWSQKNYNEYRHQWVGPILGVTIPTWFLLQWDAPFRLLILGAFLFIAAGIILHEPVFFVLRGIWFVASVPFRGIGSLVSFLLVRRLVCRPVRYV